MMRLPVGEHVARSWRIHGIAPDFEPLDLWSFRTPGAGPHDFPVMLEALKRDGGLDKNPLPIRLVYAVRWRLGATFGWDRASEGVAGRVPSLCDRLPQDLRQDVAGVPVPHTPFTIVYELSDESASEFANHTVHGVAHLGWVERGDGEYELRLAALAKPNGHLGRLYLAAIAPFRHLLVYPALTRQWERAWRERPTPTRTRASTGGSMGASVEPSDDPEAA